VRVKLPEKIVSLTLLPGDVGAGFPHPALLMGVVIMVVSGEGVMDGLGKAEADELQLAANSTQNAPKIHHKSTPCQCIVIFFVPTLDMSCLT
jgi:hypothetical protein